MADSTRRAASGTLPVKDLPPAASLSAHALGHRADGVVGARPPPQPPQPPTPSLSAHGIGVRGRHFVDEYGRVLQFKGLNVSGVSKIPASPHVPSHVADRFFEHRTVSFVGRPFPLEEAPLHFARLQAWGHTLVRFLLTWESLAHAGPREDDVDGEYVGYLRELFALMPRYGLRAFVCAHQDVWSRFSGGSGAPGWTFEVAGLDMRAFKATGAAYVHNLDAEADGQDGAAAKPAKPEPVGPFVWPSGYQKLAGATMATLFWAGDVFAWKLRVPRSWRPSDVADGPPRAEREEEHVSAREFLQDAYLDAFGRVADELGGMEACIGFDVMNEPHRGFIELHGWHGWNYNTDLHIGHYPSFLQTLALGSGYKQDVPFYVKSWPFPTRVSHTSTLDPRGRSAWLSGECLWRSHGVWEWDEARRQPVALREDFFDVDPRPGSRRREVEWYRDCWAPFVARFAERIRRKHPHLLVFLEPIPNEFHPPWPSHARWNALGDRDRRELRDASAAQRYASPTLVETPRPERVVYAPHFYDLNVLFGKVHSRMSVNVQGLSRGMFVLRGLYFGFEGLCRNYRHQLATLAEYARLSLGDVPLLVGEVGVPYDVNGGRALRDGDYSGHAQLLVALARALEASFEGYTLWNYNPHNSTEFGDSWNKEDFSVMCSEPQARDRANHLDGDELYRGGRALGAIIRPYAVKVAGVPHSTDFDERTLRFEFRWRNGADAASTPTDARSAVDDDAETRRRTDIYLPEYHYAGRRLRVVVTDGEWGLDMERQSLYVLHADTRPNVVHSVLVTALEATAPDGEAVSPSGTGTGTRPPPRDTSGLPPQRADGPSGLLLLLGAPRHALAADDWAALAGAALGVVALVAAVLWLHDSAAASGRA